jgi:hypothetical protein
MKGILKVHQGFPHGHVYDTRQRGQSRASRFHKELTGEAVIINGVGSTEGGAL